jgi:hypothetical protein
MLVLDYSASMNDDSELSAMSVFGQAAVEENIYQMWQDLGAPTYGNMGFWPDWLTFPGDGSEVTWRSEAIDVTATDGEPFTGVYLRYSTNNTQTFTGNWTSGTFAGTGGNSGKRITQAYVRIDGEWELFDFYNKATVINALGLSGVAYPYPSGSWNNYIDYCLSHSSSMPWYDYNISAAGHRRKFGMLTLINFWNLNKPQHDETPDLWKASQQPITALKEATDLLLDYLHDVEAEDLVGLSVYTHNSSAGAKLESALTNDYALIKTISRQRQAGHYDLYTNIGAGMRMGRQALVADARPHSQRVMVLMTDGIANRTLTSASPKDFALDEADLAAAADIKIMTISLGAGADTALMQEIADRTGGKHFNVPGGGNVADYQAQLEEAFRSIAADRPLRLISE